MRLTLHLLLHIFFAFLAGWLVWMFFGFPEIAFLAAFIGGVLIDLDHLIDYFLAFGLKFNFLYFLQGYNFLKSDKIYVLFHGWEYVILSVVLIEVVDVSLEIQAVVWAVTLGAFFHLLVDRYVNHGMSFKAYSLFFRAGKSFELSKIVSSDHYQEHVAMKKMVEFK